MPAEIDDTDDELIDLPTVETINSENALAAEIARVSEINRRVFEKTNELTRKDARELFDHETELKAATTTQIMATEEFTANTLPADDNKNELIDLPETPAENNTAEEKPTVVTITTKIAKNGTKMYYADGKRVSRNNAIKIAANNRENNFFTVEYTAYDSSVGDLANKTIEVTKLDLAVRNEMRKYDSAFYVVVNGKNVQAFFGLKTDASAIRKAKQTANTFADIIAQAYINSVAGVKVVGNEVAIIEPIEIIPETDGSEDDTDDQNDVFKYLPAIETLTDVDTDQTKEETAQEIPLTKAQIEKLMSAIVVEREEFYDALDAAQANEEISQSHIDYLKGEIERLGTEYYELWAQLDKLKATEKNVAEPETTENAVKVICERVRNVRRRGLNHVVTSKGRHMWYYSGSLISKDIVAVMLAKEGFTIEEYISAEETAEDYWWNVELPRMVAISNQATFLEDKHWREVKSYDEKLTANVMPPEVDDSEDELVDPPEKADIHDSLARAMKIALLKVQDFCREKNLKAAQNELSLYNICANAMRQEVTI